MRVLVTGATGFIGAHLCRALGEGGHEVAALSRDPAAARRRVPALRAAYAWGPSGLPDEALSGVEAVVNLAGETLRGRWTHAKRRAIFDSRILGTRRLVDALSRATPRPRVLVSASATGFYGDRGDEPLTESSGRGSGFLADVCVAWEAETQAAAAHGLRVVLLRTGLVLGRDGGALQALLLPFKLGAGGPLGSGRQWWPWVHIDDVTGTVLHALSSAVEGPVNVTAPEPVRQVDLARALGGALHRPALLPVPAFALRLALGEVATELLYSRRALPERLAASGYRFKQPGLDGALGELLATR
jgi:uncharacterized protein (TIGR01777 family)